MPHVCWRSLACYLTLGLVLAFGAAAHAGEATVYPSARTCIVGIHRMIGDAIKKADKECAEAQKRHESCGGPSFGYWWATNGPAEKNCKSCHKWFCGKELTEK